MSKSRPIVYTNPSVEKTCLQFTTSMLLSCPALSTPLPPTHLQPLIVKHPQTLPDIFKRSFEACQARRTKLCPSVLASSFYHLLLYCPFHFLRKYGNKEYNFKKTISENNNRKVH